MWQYYIPFLYTLKTRTSSLFSIISVFIFTCIPDISILMLYKENSVYLLFIYSISFLGMYCVYECGYIYNDVVTVRFEQNPTYRIPEQLVSGMLKNIEAMIAVRLLIAMGICWLLFLLGYDVTLYTTGLVLILGVYSIHNYFRNRVNILTMFLLVSLKNMLPIIPFFAVNDYCQIFGILFIIIILIRTLEYAAKDRYKIHFLRIKNVDTFRVYYYSVLSICLIFLWQFKLIRSEIVYLGVFFWIYRAGCKIMLMGKR